MVVKILYAILFLILKINVLPVKAFKNLTKRGFYVVP